MPLTSPQRVASRFLQARLSTNDKEALDNFLRQKPSESKHLISEGDSLHKKGLGGGVIAYWNRNDLLVLQTEDGSRFSQKVEEYLRQKLPNNKVTDYVGKLDFSAHGDVFGDQYETTLVAKHNGDPVGYIKYTLWNGEVTIQIIHVASPYRGQGIAKRIIQEVLRRERIPYRELDWGMLTNQGAALKKKLDREGLR